MIAANMGFIYYLAGDYSRAEESEKSAIQMDPSFVPAYTYLGQICLEKKQHKEAIEQFQTALALSPGDNEPLEYLAYAHAISGNKKEAEEILKELQKRKKRVTGYDYAVIYAGLRDADETLEWLEKAYVEKSGRLVNLQVHPQFAFLRGERRFDSIVEKIWGNKLLAPSQQ